MSDPLFPHLPLSTRKQVLLEIDPKFANMNGGKQDLFLWRAETTYLPKAVTPKRTFVWSPTDLNSSTELQHDNRSCKDHQG